MEQFKDIKSMIAHLTNESTNDEQEQKIINRTEFHKRKVREIRDDALKTHDPIGYIRQSLQDLPDFNSQYSDDDILDLLVDIDNIFKNKGE